MARKPATKPAVDRGLASPGYLDVEDRAADPRGLDPMLAAAMTSMGKLCVDKEGNKTFLTAEESKSRLFGIPLPCLALAYAFDCDALVPGRMLVTVGPPGSLKSTLTLEFLRLIAEYGGLSNYACNELKPPIGTLHAICRNDPAVSGRVFMTQTDSVEGWQNSFHSWINTANSVALGTQSKANPGQGWTVPWGWAIDSLTGTGADKSHNNFEKDGQTKMDFSVVANHLNRFCQVVGRHVYDKPIFLFGVNHMKEKADAHTGLMLRHVPGGRAMNFLESSEIELKKIGEFRHIDHSGVRLKLKMFKNCYGESGHSIIVNCLWRKVKMPDGSIQQDIWWDWPAATVEMLLGFETQAGMKGKFKQLQEICHLRQVRAGFVCSNTLGIPKEKPISYSAAGRLIEESRQLYTDLRAALGIFRFRCWRPGADFVEAIQNSDDIFDSADARRIYHVADNETLLNSLTLDAPSAISYGPGVGGEVNDDDAAAAPQEEDLDALFAP